MSNETNWAGWISGSAAAGGLLWAFFKRFFASVTRDELEQTLQRFHLENTSRLEDIKETVTRTHERVDNIYRDFGSNR